MKKFRIALHSSIVLLAIIALTAWVDDQKEPSNCIRDGKGLRIDLDWTTGGNIPGALLEADLDLDVFKGEGEILSSYNSYEFEQVDLTNTFEDGVYTVKVSAHEISNRCDYTLKVSGSATGKSFRVVGVFNTDEVQPTAFMLKITKVGEQFTVSAL